MKELAKLPSLDAMIRDDFPGVVIMECSCAVDVQESDVDLEIVATRPMRQMDSYRHQLATAVNEYILELSETVDPKDVPDAEIKRIAERVNEYKEHMMTLEVLLWQTGRAHFDSITRSGPQPELRKGWKIVIPSETPPDFSGLQSSFEVEGLGSVTVLDLRNL